MMFLTFAAIEADPWNAVECALPTDADRALLEAAYRAAQQCAATEYRLMTAARDRAYVPTGWTAGEDAPDVHEFNEARWFQAEQRMNEIAARLDDTRQ